MLSINIMSGSPNLSQKRSNLGQLFLMNGNAKYLEFANHIAENSKCPSNLKTGT